jgi:hypothetical protein
MAGVLQKKLGYLMQHCASLRGARRERRFEIGDEITILQMYPR